MTIKEIAGKTGVSADTLRYYERIGVIPPVPRTESGIRDYSDYHVGWLAFIHSLKASGLSLEGILDYLSLARRGDATCEARRQVLQEAKNRLLEQIALLETSVRQADFQLDNYENVLVPETKELVQRWQENAC